VVPLIRRYGLEDWAPKEYLAHGITNSTAAAPKVRLFSTECLQDSTSLGRTSTPFMLCFCNLDALFDTKTLNWVESLRILDKTVVESKQQNNFAAKKLSSAKLWFRIVIAFNGTTRVDSSGMVSQNPRIATLESVSKTKPWKWKRLVWLSFAECEPIGCKISWQVVIPMKLVFPQKLQKYFRYSYDRSN